MALSDLFLDNNLGYKPWVWLTALVLIGVFIGLALRC